MLRRRKRARIELPEPAVPGSGDETVAPVEERRGQHSEEPGEGRDPAHFREHPYSGAASHQSPLLGGVGIQDQHERVQRTGVEPVALQVGKRRGRLERDEPVAPRLVPTEDVGHHAVAQRAHAVVKQKPVGRHGSRLYRGAIVYNERNRWGSDCVAARNLGDLLRTSCAEWGEKPAFLVRDQGDFEPVSYATLWDRACAYAAALGERGIRRGDRVAIQSENCCEWAQADWACQLLGAILVPIYPTLPPDQSRYIVADSESKLLLAGSEEQLDKHRDGEGVELLLLVGEGDSLDAQSQKLLGTLTNAVVDGWIEGTQPTDLATIIYTSGTTGAPKGAMLAHEGFTMLMESIVQSLPIDHNDRFLSFLPMSHVYERVAGQVLPISCGATIGFAGSLRSLPSDMKAVQPTVMLCVPRFLESIRDKVVEKASKAPLLRKKLFETAMVQLVRRYQGKSAPLAGLMDTLVASKVRALTGGKLRFFVSGGAALPTHVSEFFIAFGMPMLQGYGLTETTAATCINHPDDNHPDTVGPPLPGVEVRLAQDGEILVRGKSRMIGYWNHPEETAQAIDAEGWFHTGDIGAFEGPYLKITDRKKDILVLGNGKNVAPQPIENKLKESPLISEAVLFGDGMECVCALIVPDFDALTQAAADHGLAPAPPEQLIELDAVKQLIKREIDKVNKTLADFERVKKHRLLAATFSIEGGELTPTLKVRRKVVKEKYAAVLAELTG